MTNTLSICTFNVRGLNDRAKRQRVAQEIRIMSPDVICLQETHIPWTKHRLLTELGYKLLVCTTQETTTRGVAILVKGNMILGGKSLADKCGRWAIVECTVAQKKLTIYSVYGSNHDGAHFLEYLNTEVALWASTLILCGDFNIQLEEVTHGPAGHKSWS